MRLFLEHQNSFYWLLIVELAALCLVLYAAGIESTALATQQRLSLKLLIKLLSGF